jgi:hypothetical protein
VTCELKLASAKREVWDGETPEGAARGYVAGHPAETVVAWRHWPRHGLFAVDPRSMVRVVLEPADRAWER